MPSTYTTNNGIELIATGEQSGTWGTTTNTNLELLDASLDGQVTITLSSAGSSGSPNDLPVTNGSASNGRNRVVIFNDGGDLGATAYVQLTPNDAEKIMYIRNSLSGSRDIIVFQGTYNASNDYVVPNGTTAVVFFDGAGTGAVAANVFNNAAFDALQLGTSDVSVNKILDQDDMSGNDASALATQQSIKAYVDSQVGTVDTLAEVLANGNTTGGTNIELTTTDKVQFRDSAIYLNSSADGQLDIVADTEVQIATTTVDLNGALDVSGALTVGGLSTVRAGDSSTPSLESSAGDLVLKAGADDVIIQTGGSGGEAIQFMDSAGTVYFDADMETGNITQTSTDAGSAAGPEFTLFRDSASPADGDYLGQIKFDGKSDTGVTRVYAKITGKTSDVSNTTEDGLIETAVKSNGSNVIVSRQTGTALKLINGVGLEVAGDATIGETSASDRTLSIGSAGATHFDVTTEGATGIVTLNATNDSTAGKINLQTADTDRLLISNNGDISFYNDAGTSKDLFWDASLSILGLGTTSPSNALHIKNSNPTIRLEDSDGSGTGASQIQNTASGNLRLIADYDNSAASSSIEFEIDGTEHMRLTSAGRLGLGTTSPSDIVQVKSTSNGDGLTLQRSSLTSGDYAQLGFLATTNDAGTPNLWIRGHRGATFETSYMTFGTGASVGSEQMRIDSSGNVGIGTTSPSTALDVAGTVTADDVIVSGSTPVITLADTDGTNQLLQIQEAGGAGYIDVRNNTSHGTFNLRRTNGTDTFRTMQVQSSGDIAIYADDGTTKAFYWDASTSRLGLGRTNPAEEFHIDASIPTIRLQDSDGTDQYANIYQSGGTTNIYTRNGTDYGDFYIRRYNGTDLDISFRVQNNGDIIFYGDDGSTQGVKFDASSNRLGIGTTAPSTPLHVSSASVEVARAESTGTSGSYLTFLDADTTTGQKAWIGADADLFKFYSNNTTLNMTMNTSGNTGFGSTTIKTRLQVSGAGAANTPSLGSVSSNVPLYLTNNDTAYGLVVGNSASTGNAWLQAQRTDGIATAYNIELNPAGGNVGVGRTSSSVVRLSVAGTDATASNYAFEATNSSLATKFIVRNDGQSQFFKSDNSASMTLTSDGNLLVGKTSPNVGIAGVEFRAGSSNYMVTSNDTVLGLNRLSSVGTVQEFRKDTTVVGTISVTASATSYNTSSDQRLKDNIVDAPSSSDDIDAIQVRSFDWKADGSHQKYGMIAQELQTVAPEAVSEGETEEDMMGVDYSKLVPMMLKEIQSLRARVAQLEGAN